MTMTLLIGSLPSNKLMPDALATKGGWEPDNKVCKVETKFLQSLNSRGNSPEKFVQERRSELKISACH